MTNVTLGIPCYNAKDYLPELLYTALNQSKKFYEIIIYDDASTDESSDIAKNFCIKYIRGEENKGAAFARNKLLECASGEYIHFHDADDKFLSTEFVEEISKFCDGSTCILVDTIFFEKDGLERVVPERRLRPGETWAEFFLSNIAHLNGAVFPVRAVRRIGGFPEVLKTRQDLYLFAGLAAHGYQFVHLQKSLAGHWKRDGSTLDRLAPWEHEVDSLKLLERLFNVMPLELRGRIFERRFHHLRNLVSLGELRRSFKYLDETNIPIDCSLYIYGPIERWIAGKLGIRAALMYYYFRTRSQRVSG